MEFFHVTWITYASILSSEQADNCKNKPVWLNFMERKLVCNFLNKKILEKGYKIIALNVLGNHVHLILFCNEQKLSEIVGQLKGFSAYHLNRVLEHEVVYRKRFVSTLLGLKPQEWIGKNARKSPRVWARKYGWNSVDDDKHLSAVVAYVNENHLGHGQPALPHSIQFAALTKLEEIDFPFG